MLDPNLYIAFTNEIGRGVFTKEIILKDTVIEVAPVIVMSGSEREYLDETLLHDYIFEWGEKKEQCCVALGYISMYNHSNESNSEYFMNFDDDTIFIKTVRKINKGEEITINYNGTWNNAAKLWFDAK